MKKTTYVTKPIAIFVVLFFLGFSSGFSQKKVKTTLKSTEKLAQNYKKEKVIQAEAKEKIERYKVNFFKKFNDEHTRISIRHIYRKEIHQKHKELWREINRELFRYKENYIKFLVEKKYLLEDYKNTLNLMIDRGLIKTAKINGGVDYGNN